MTKQREAHEVSADIVEEYVKTGEVSVRLRREADLVGVSTDGCIAIAYDLYDLVEESFNEQFYNT